ncbi:MAG: XdhC family protein [Anaerolineae bacterium]|nr:XdhC family protein [Anaerolineae bacterium]
MENIYQLVAKTIAAGSSAALCTIVRIEGSTPREVGAKMLVFADGRTAGTVGGGEMEALVIDAAAQAIRHGTSQMMHYELRDTGAGDPGICGGSADLFIDVIAPPPTLLIAGGGHVAMPVAEMGYMCGFRVVVVDDREEMVSQERFPHASERIARDISEGLGAWPITSNTHIVIVTRGHACDEDALRAVIASPAAYIGMIGSRRKVQTILDHLRQDRVSQNLIDRVRSPIGLNIGSETPAEIAISILAEIIMLNRGRDGRPMKNNL